MEWAEDYLSLMSGEAPGGIGYLVVDVGGEDAAALQACRAPEITGHRRPSCILQNYRLVHFGPHRQSLTSGAGNFVVLA